MRVKQQTQTDHTKKYTKDYVYLGTVKISKENFMKKFKPKADTSVEINL